ncbi:hypothetical protein DNTS_009906 [Danionella cerebrum]|uniref:COMM domain-containing protein 3 n=1 Tax=Danionella cerebrum TaxID=2873325 RepID=A0A553RDT6_9TELE|nr:hypothetical protein DNTS_009906 [Danionella translucida]
MEVSESVMKGLQTLADPSLFDLKSFILFTEVAFDSLLSPRGESALVGFFIEERISTGQLVQGQGKANQDLKHIDPITLKSCHTAATTFILEGIKHNVDKSTMGSCLEDLRFSTERVDIFYTSFQKNKTALECLLSSIDSCPPHVTDVTWRLEYCLKVGLLLLLFYVNALDISCLFSQQNSHVHKVNQPSYLISLNTEKGGTSSHINFNCTMEQLQDLVGKMKDAAKSLERATQA